MKSPGLPTNINGLSEFTEFPASGVSMGTHWRNVVSLVVVSPLKQQPQCFDVIVYKSPGGLIAHRIIHSALVNEKRWWITKGDGFLSPDRIPVDEKDVLGVVVAVRTASGVNSAVVPGGFIRRMVHGVICRISLFFWPPLWKVTEKSSC